MIVIPDRDINALTISGDAPLDASERTAWPNRCAPNDVAVLGIKRPIDAALLAKADDGAQEIRPCPSKVEIWAGRYGTVRVCSRRWVASSKTACTCEGVNALQPL